MPSPRILDLSPIPNEMGRQFGENFAGGFQRAQDRRWFDEAIGEETDPYLQLQKMRQSKHPFSPEFSKERRRELFEDMDARMTSGREDRDLARRKREEGREDTLWGREDERYERGLKQEEQNLAFLEQQMGLSPGSLSGANSEFVRPIAQKAAEQRMNRAEEERNKNALASAYQEELADLPQETFNKMTEKQVGDYVKNKQKPDRKTPQDLGQEQFFKAQGKEASNKLNEAKKKIEDIKGNKETISRLKELNKKLSGVGGYTKIILGNKDTSEFNALGHSLIKVPLSIFNPTGPVAVKKMEQLKDMYAVTASERSGTIEGKLKAAEWMNSLSEKAAQAQIDLYSKYNGFPPVEELERMNEDIERAIIDPALAQSFQEGAEQIVGGFYSAKDGRPLKPMPKSKALDLMEKGLITHERPR